MRPTTRAELVKHLDSAIDYWRKRKTPIDLGQIHPSVEKVIQKIGEPLIGVLCSQGFLYRGVQAEAALA